MKYRKLIWIIPFLFICTFFSYTDNVRAANVLTGKSLNSENVLLEKRNASEIQMAAFHKKISKGLKKAGDGVKKGVNKVGKGVSKGVNKVGKTIDKGAKTISRGAKIGAGAVVGAGVAAGAAIAAGANAVVDAAKDFRFSQEKPFAKSGKCKAKRPGKLNASYCNYAEVNMKACAKMFGKKACVGPGKFKTTVAGTTGIVTYLNQKDGKIGATLDARQTVTMNFFGKPLKVGLSCQLTKGAKSSWSQTFGVNFQTPAFPPITTTDVLEAIVTRGAKAAAKTAAKSAAMKSGAKNMNQAMAGYAGSATAGEMMKLMKSSGCNLIIPEAKLFNGIKSFNLARAGARITVAVKNWKIKGKTASADFIVSSGIEAAVGGTKQKIVGKTVKMPGYSWGKDFANLVKFNVSTGGKGKDLSRAVSDNNNRKAPRLAYNPGKPRPPRAAGNLRGLMNKPVCIRATKGQYVVVEKNQKVVNANRPKCGSWETFIIRGDSIYNTAWKTYLSCQPNGRLEGNRKKVGSWEKIKVIPQKGGTFAFRCMAHGKKYLVAEGAGGKIMNANRAKVGGWERFRIEPKKGGQARKPKTGGSIAGKVARLKVQHSNQCVDVSGGSKKKGQGLIQWSCHKGANQRFKLEPRGKGFYRIRAQHSNQCLDIRGGSKKRGADLIQWSCHNGPNQQWKLESAGGGWYRIKARHSNQCLDVSGGSKKRGQKLIQWPCHKGANQKFRLN